MSLISSGIVVSMFFAKQKISQEPHKSLYNYIRGHIIVEAMRGHSIFTHDYKYDIHLQGWWTGGGTISILGMPIFN